MELAPQSESAVIAVTPEVLDYAKQLAAEENRSVCEVVRDALSAYDDRHSLSMWATIREYVAEANPHGYTEEDVPRLIREVREEDAAELARLRQ